MSAPNSPPDYPSPNSPWSNTWTPNLPNNPIQTELDRLLVLYESALHSQLDSPESKRAPSMRFTTTTEALRAKIKIVQHLSHFLDTLPHQNTPNPNNPQGANRANPKDLQLQIALTALPPLAGFVIQPDGGTADELANLCFSIANAFIKKSQEP